MFRLVRVQTLVDRNAIPWSGGEDVPVFENIEWNCIDSGVCRLGKRRVELERRLLTFSPSTILLFSVQRTRRILVFVVWRKVLKFGCFLTRFPRYLTKTHVIRLSSLRFGWVCHDFSLNLQKYKMNTNWTQCLLHSR